ncbi:SEC-C motif-containing protein [Bacillus cereus]|uniref:YkgJ family cysteine cluster protein n=1 Tax=Bacillus cereus TaxID=1396 RepID=UPI001D15A0EF|nr:SEC-C motif-containing protein [Bacillus cereus]MCC3686997.1 SEC-C motif-containing protein [Bacillus cereus]
MSRNELCYCGSGRKRKKCHKEVHNNSYIEILSNLYQAIENEKTYNSRDKEHPCKNGCFNCCYDSFIISMLEFEYILYDLRKNHKEIIEDVFNAALEGEKLLKEQDPELLNYFVKDATGLDARMESREANQKLINKRTIPFVCPLLDKETGKCMVYDNRPFICRMRGNTHTYRHTVHDTKICDHILSSKQNAKNTPFIHEGYFDRVELLNLGKYGNQYLSFRRFPIFFWFCIYKQKNERRGKEMYESLLPNYFNKPEGTISFTDVVPHEVKKTKELK